MVALHFLLIISLATVWANVHWVIGVIKETILAIKIVFRDNMDMNHQVKELAIVLPIYL
jgi:hypothetical protein